MCLVVLVCYGLSSCRTSVQLPSITPEETGLNLIKITDETKGSVISSPLLGSSAWKPAQQALGTNEKANVRWYTHRLLAVSPDGSEIAYLTRNKDHDNIMVRSTVGSAAATQRTFRNVNGFSWGNDNNLYFIDNVDQNNRKVCSVNAHAGTFIQQLTSNNSDADPVLSPDGKKVFFTRLTEGSAPSIWSYNLENGQLINCAVGYNVAGINEDGTEFICVRNSEAGNSEIWRVNYVTGRETVILSDSERSYTHPSLSPDGQWLLVAGNSQSSINKRKNLDIFAVKLDGSAFTQLTYHPEDDMNPQWSPDGSSIYFISSRANKDKRFNVWKMNFRPY